MESEEVMKADRVITKAFANAHNILRSKVAPPFPPEFSWLILDGPETMTIVYQPTGECWGIAVCWSDSGIRWHGSLISLLTQVADWSDAGEDLDAADRIREAIMPEEMH